MNHFNTLILAAANTSTQFKTAGFTASRNLKVVDGKPLILNAIDSYYDKSGKLAIAINRDEENSEQKLWSLLIEKYPTADVFQVGSEVQGALISALIASEKMPHDSPLLIANGDSFLKNHIHFYLSEIADTKVGARTLCFESSNPRWSYLVQNSDGEVAEVVEKSVISKYATTGAFLFSKTSEFIEAAEWVLINRAQTQGRYFVSTALNFLISRGMRVTFDLIDRREYRNYSLPSDFVEQAT